MKWLQQLFRRATPKPAEASPGFFSPEIEVQFTPSDREALRRFLATVSGDALKSALNIEIAKAEQSAVDTGKKYECGRARGWRECAALIKSLSETPTPQQTEHPEFVVAGDEDALEQPHSP